MGSEVDNWMPLWIGDYLADTMHLTTEQHGAYLLLIFHQWRQGEIPDDDEVLAQIARLQPAAWKRSRPVLARFFTIADGRWVQGRAAREKAGAAEARERIGQVRSAAGRAGARARWGNRNPEPPGGGGNGGGKPGGNRNGKRMANAWQDDGSPPSPATTSLPGGSAPRASAVDLAVEARQWGVQTTGSHPSLIELAKQGVTLESWRDALRVAKDRGALNVGYLVATLNGWAQDAQRVQASGAVAPSGAPSKGAAFLAAVDRAAGQADDGRTIDVEATARGPRLVGR